MNSFYGTAEYIDEYFKDYADRISYVKLNSGELLIGFVFDDLYKNKTQIAYPLLVLRTQLNVFSFTHWTPDLESPSVTIKDDSIASIMAPNDSFVSAYKETVKAIHVRIEPLEGNDTVH